MTLRPGGRALVGASVLFVAGMTLPRCTAATQPAAAPPVLEPIVTVKELMENVVDPMSDGIFDAVAVRVEANSMVETKPTTDDDWARVEHAAVTLAEATTLLKIPRQMAPANDPSQNNPIDGPELPPSAIQAHVDRDRALWNKHADALRDEALKVRALVKARDADKLFEAGSNIDRACEACHLEYWYPGDRAAVLRDRQSRAFTEPIKK